jgi:hypothetical protein
MPKNCDDVHFASRTYARIVQLAQHPFGIVVRTA